MAGRMAECGHAGHTGDNIVAITDKGHHVSHRAHVCLETLVFGTGPVVVLDLTGHITGIRECRHAVGHQPTDVVAMHMGQHDDIDLIGGITCGRDRGDCGRAVQSGVKQNEFRARVYNCRREKEVRHVGR